MWVLLVTVFAAFAGWQEIKARDEEEHTTALWHELTGTDHVSSLTPCIEKNANGKDIEACLKIQAAVEKAIGRYWSNGVSLTSSLPTVLNVQKSLRRL